MREKTPGKEGKVREGMFVKLAKITRGYVDVGGRVGGKCVRVCHEVCRAGQGEVGRGRRRGVLAEEE